MSAAEDAGSDEDPGGLYTWLLGMVVSFVLTGTVVTTSALSSGSSPGISSTSTAMHKTKVPRPKTILHLLEILNLYVMFSRVTRMEDMLILRPPSRELLEKGPPTALREALRRFERVEHDTVAKAEDLAVKSGLQLPDL